MSSFTTAEGEDFSLELIDCEGGNVSICAVFAEEIREDPSFANVPREEGEDALERYEKHDDYASIDLNSVDRWPVVETSEPLV